MSDKADKLDLLLSPAEPVSEVLSKLELPVDLAPVRSAETLDEYMERLAELSFRARDLSVEQLSMLRRAARANPALYSLSEQLSAPQLVKLLLVGMPSLCMRIADGVSLRALADEVGVPLFLLYKFLTSKENKPLYKEARAAAAHKFIDDADEAARDQRRSEAEHWRWRAERSSPEEFGKPVDSEPQRAATANAVFNLLMDLTPDAQAEAAAAREEAYREASAAIEGDAKDVLDDVWDTSVRSGAGQLSDRS